MSLFLVVLSIPHSAHSGLMDTIKQAAAKLDKFKESATSKLKKVKETVKGIHEKVIENVSLLKPLLPKPVQLPLEILGTDNEITDGEEEVLKKRLPKIRQALTALVGDVQDATIPTIGIVGSGGGYRAMIAMLGFTWALEKIGVLDTASYISALSGSTWMLNTWLAHGYSLAQMNTFLKNQTKDSFSLKVKNKEIDINRITLNLLQKVAYKQPVSLVDVYGSILGSVLLKGLPGNGLDFYMSDLENKIADGSYPYPISTAVFEHTRPFEWLEFSPYEVGTAAFKYWIKPDYFGQLFDNGKSLDIGPRQSLGFMFGIFGSAYAVSIGEVLREVVQGIEAKISEKLTQFKIPNAVGAILIQQMGLLQEVSVSQGNQRISPPRVHNFMRGLQNGDQFGEAVTVVDAGIDFNLPFPPLLRRNVGVYLVCDASDYPNLNYHALKKVEEFAKRKQFKFPAINYEGIDKRGVSVFYDKTDPEVPVVIYFPNMTKVSTFKFHYTNDEFDTVHNTMYKQVVKARADIIKGLKLGIENVKKLVTSQQSGVTVPQDVISDTQDTSTSDDSVQAAEPPVTDDTVAQTPEPSPQKATLDQNITQLEAFAKKAGNSPEAQQLRDLIEAMKALRQ